MLSVRALFDTLVRRATSDDGFTLAELLMGILLSVLVVAIATTVFTSAVQTQPGLNKRDQAISNARVTMERLVRELRQGSTVFSGTSTSLSFLTYFHSATCGGQPSQTAISCRVTYNCAAGSCTRAEAQPDGTNPGAAATAVSGLSNSIVFDYSPATGAPKYVGATFTFPGQNGDDAITVSDGAALRNPTS